MRMTVKACYKKNKTSERLQSWVTKKSKTELTAGVLKKKIKRNWGKKKSHGTHPSRSTQLTAAK